MSLNNRNSSSFKNRSKILWAVGILILLSIVLVTNKTNHWWPFMKSAQEIQKEQAAEQDNQKKEDTINNSGKNGDNSSAPGQGTYTPPTSAENITLTPSQSGSQVTLLTKLAGYSDGSCILTIKNGSKDFSQTANVIYQSEFSTCAGFSIPVGNLGSGNWSFNLDVVSGGITTSKTATLEVR